MKLQKIVKKYFKKCYRANENKINYSQLKNLSQNQDSILIDIRSPQEYKEGHLSYAINIPFYEISNQIIDIIKDKNSIIILYCQSGHRSSKILKELKKLNYKNVYELEGGLNEIY